MIYYHTFLVVLVNDGLEQCFLSSQFGKTNYLNTTRSLFKFMFLFVKYYRKISN